MSGGEIGYVNIIPYASSIRSIKILTEDRERRSHTEGRTDREWNKMRLRRVNLADRSQRVRSSSVK